MRFIPTSRDSHKHTQVDGSSEEFEGGTFGATEENDVGEDQVRAFGQGAGAVVPDGLRDDDFVAGRGGT